MLAASVTSGATVSATVTENDRVARLPDGSRAVHSTVVEPRGNTEPEAGAHETVAPKRSVAVGVV